ncbi:MAG TPA: long-chain fatty acid--CoA ligase [Propioniciclava sp.]|jgi:long-chain acyl-CoA synthetase|uniref:AMP-dependent synthetase/ligase n=1 Tax=Propioniciclava sp. TaxID=2038686 RepID=UPI002C449205|nr:long-chain fatty acid--CoA ligase [Propioniciclava sp.]HRL50047.1 long-chain fatty acid--CoA ligase [Propioniciclava sp.]
MTDIQQRLDSRPPTVGAMFNDRVAASPQAEAFRYPDDHGAWVSLTWTRTREIVWEIAAGLLALGLGTEERVAIASSTRIEWVLLDLAINCAGGATTTVYPNTQGEEFAHIITHSDSRIFVAENADQLAKLRDLVGTEKLAGVVLLDGSDPDALSLDALREAGRAHLAEHPTSVDDAVAATSPDTLATLIYTSGTTGLPKGVELVHSNWTYEGAAVDALGIIGPDSLQYFWLPLSHVFGKAVMMIQLQIGFGSVVDGRLDQIVPGLGATHPIFMCGAPRIFEKVRNAVKANTATGVKAKIARWAFAVGRESRPYRLAGQKLPFAMGIAYAIADRLVFSSLKEKMGGNIEFFISGSAKLSEQVQEWFYSAGIVIVEGYGLTETSAVAAVNEPHTPRFGTVGPALPGSEFRIAEDGEVLLKGPGVMRGYHKDPEQTAEVLDADGWFHTGDIGELDAEGYLRITDRKKDLMKTSGGKYVAPQKVEGALAANIPYVSQAVAVGDGRKYISALLTLDPAAVENWAKRHGKEGLSYAEVTQLPEMRVSIDRFMTRANRKLERWETVKKYQILDHELSVERGGVTANMKLRRAAISQDYADVIDSMYEVED